MIVYVVICNMGYDGQSNEGVFSTLDKAQEYIDLEEASLANITNGIEHGVYSIEYWTLDDPEKE